MSTSSPDNENVVPLFKDEHPLFTIETWKDDVMNDWTRLGYDDWAQEKMSKL